MTNLFGSICISDIPKRLITTGKNGKEYLNIDIRERKSPDAYGHTHFIKVYDRNAPKGQQDTFIGQLKAASVGIPASTPANTQQQARGSYDIVTDNDIPF